MALDTKKFDSILIGGNQLHTYRSDDTRAAIFGAGYFDNKELAQRVKVGEGVVVSHDQDGSPGIVLGLVTVVDEAVPTVTIILGDLA